MEKLSSKTYRLPRLTRASYYEMEREAKNQIMEIIPRVLSNFPKEVLASIDLFPYNLRNMWERNDVVIVNENEFKGDFITITITEGPYDFEFSTNSSIFSPHLLYISIKFKIQPLEVVYPVGVYPRNKEVVYDAIELFYRLKHASKGSTEDGFEFCFSEASYPEDWQICNGCYKPYDVNELDFSDKFYTEQPLGYRKTVDEIRKAFKRSFGSGAEAKCPHCGQQNRYFPDNHFRTLKEYDEFWKKP